MFEKNEKNLKAMLSDDELENVSGGYDIPKSPFVTCPLCRKSIEADKMQGHLETH